MAEASAKTPTIVQVKPAEAEVEPLARPETDSESSSTSGSFSHGFPERFTNGSPDVFIVTRKVLEDGDFHESTEWLADNILRNPLLYGILIEHASKTFSDENLLFVTKTDAYRRARAGGVIGLKTRAMAQSIYDTHICEKSEREINIPSAVREELRVAFQEAKMGPGLGDTLPVEIFASCDALCIKTLAGDIWPRFLKGPIKLETLKRLQCSEGKHLDFCDSSPQMLPGDEDNDVAKWLTGAPWKKLKAGIAKADSICGTPGLVRNCLQLWLEIHDMRHALLKEDSARATARCWNVLMMNTMGELRSSISATLRADMLLNSSAPDHESFVEYQRICGEVLFSNKGSMACVVM